MITTVNPSGKPGEAQIWCYPPFCGKAWHGGQIRINVRTCKFVLALPGYCLGWPVRAGPAARRVSRR